jgi:hypothetical protein
MSVVFFRMHIFSLNMFRLHIFLVTENFLKVCFEELHKISIDWISDSLLIFVFMIIFELKMTLKCLIRGKMNQESHFNK